MTFAFTHLANFESYHKDTFSAARLPSSDIKIIIKPNYLSSPWKIIKHFCSFRIGNKSLHTYLDLNRLLFVEFQRLVCISFLNSKLVIHFFSKTFNRLKKKKKKKKKIIRSRSDPPIRALKMISKEIRIRDLQECRSLMATRQAEASTTTTTTTATTPMTTTMIRKRFTKMSNVLLRLLQVLVSFSDRFRCTLKTM